MHRSDSSVLVVRACLLLTSHDRRPNCLHSASPKASNDSRSQEALHGSSLRAPNASSNENELGRHQNWPLSNHDRSRCPDPGTQTNSEKAVGDDVAGLRVVRVELLDELSKSRGDTRLLVILISNRIYRGSGITIQKAHSPHRGYHKTP